MYNAKSPTDYTISLPNFLKAVTTHKDASRRIKPITATTDSIAYAQGETIIAMMGLSNSAYVVDSGELAIYVNGLPVDIIEAGEYFDESICCGGQAVALTDCTLRPVNQPSVIQH